MGISAGSHFRNFFFFNFICSMYLLSFLANMQVKLCNAYLYIIKQTVPSSCPRVMILLNLVLFFLIIFSNQSWKVPAKGPPQSIQTHIL